MGLRVAFCGVMFILGFVSIGQLVQIWCVGGETHGDVNTGSVGDIISLLSFLKKGRRFSNRNL
jgi:hypothetical protein